jgi:hypothetical protein
LYADSITTDQERIGFARVLVEVHSDSSFPKEILVKGAGGRMFTVGVEYPWIPLKFKNCKSFGNAVHACPKVEKKVWMPKNREVPKLVVKGKVNMINIFILKFYLE